MPAKGNPLTELGAGATCLVVSVPHGRLLDLGLVSGTKLIVVRSAPFGGPVEILVRGSTLAIGREMARKILVKKEGVN